MRDRDRRGAGALADPGSLRRIERLAVAWTAAGALGYGLASSWPGALVLTAISGVAIVLFRGLQRIVSVLGPAGNAPDDPPEADRSAPADSTGDRGLFGRRPALGAVARLALLGAVAVAASLLLDPEYFPAIVLGFSTLPAALMTEGLLQGVRALREENHDDVP